MAGLAGVNSISIERERLTTVCVISWNGNYTDGIRGRLYLCVVCVLVTVCNILSLGLSGGGFEVVVLGGRGGKVLLSSRNAG